MAISIKRLFCLALLKRSILWSIIYLRLLPECPKPSAATSRSATAHSATRRSPTCAVASASTRRSSRCSGNQCGRTCWCCGGGAARWSILRSTPSRSTRSPRCTTPTSTSPPAPARQARASSARSAPTSTSRCCCGCTSRRATSGCWCSR